jgi:hypothetical protein
LIKKFADNLKPRTDKEKPPEFKDDEKASQFLQEVTLLEK